MLALRSSAPGVTEIRLDPPGLGRLRLDLRTGGTVAHLVIEARPQVLDLLRGGLPALAGELRGLGYERVEITFADTARPAADGTQTDGSARQGPGGGPQQGAPPPPDSAAGTGTAGTAPADRADPPPGHAAAPAPAPHAGLDLRL